MFKFIVLATVALACGVQGQLQPLPAPQSNMNPFFSAANRLIGRQPQVVAQPVVVNTGRGQQQQQVQQQQYQQQLLIQQQQQRAQQELVMYQQALQRQEAEMNQMRLYIQQANQQLATRPAGGTVQPGQPQPTQPGQPTAAEVQQRAQQVVQAQQQLTAQMRQFEQQKKTTEDGLKKAVHELEDLRRAELKKQQDQQRSFQQFVDQKQREIQAKEQEIARQQAAIRAQQQGRV